MAHRYFCVVLTRQLRLFAHPKPLLDRLGSDFFRAVPATPGVYLMKNETGRVLYVGQSGNLRRRLGSYKNAHPDHLPRKIIRLVHAAHTIAWEECETAGQARQREIELLLLHQPKFNSASPRPRAYCYLGWQLVGSCLTCFLFNELPGNLQESGVAPTPALSPVGTSRAPLPWPTSTRRTRQTEGCMEMFQEVWREGPERLLSSGEHVYGAFKPRARQAYAALLRSLWAAWHQPTSPHDFPRPLLGGKPPRVFTFQVEPGAKLKPALAADGLDQFLSGSAVTFIEVLSQMLSKAGQRSIFQQELHLADTNLLTEFFASGPQRNRQLRQRFQLPTPVIPADELDILRSSGLEAVVNVPLVV